MKRGTRLRRNLPGFLAGALAFLCAIPAPVGAESGEEGQKPVPRLAAGDKVPVLHYRDLDGQEGSNEDTDRDVIVYCFADRKSNKVLSEWLGKAQVEVFTSHPALKIAFVSFADTAMVPERMRKVITPVLRAIDGRVSKQREKFYTRQGVDLASLDVTFSAVPDWTGEYLASFGLDDAKVFQIFITAANTVVAVLDGNTPDVERKFVDAFAEDVLSRCGRPQQPDKE